MLVLHAHWSLPGAGETAAGILFWAETSDIALPPRARGRPASRAAPREHAFCAPIEALRAWLTPLPYQAQGRPHDVVLWLPSVRGLPLPSPGLLHDWDIETAREPELRPWRVRGLWLPAEAAVSALISVPAAVAPTGLTPGADAIYWRTAAGLALEVLASQRFLPGLVPVDEKRGVYHARWLPVLDGPEDAPRLTQLARAMPPLCRAEADRPEEPVTPRRLLDGFLKVFVDALARAWATPPPYLRASADDPTVAWLAALFGANPVVRASPAQLKRLYASYRAWLRNLHAAGDATFRVAFRLEAPLQRADAAAADGLPAGVSGGWHVYYLLQARDDPSLLVPAEAVWQARGSVLQSLGRRFEQPQERLLAGLGYAARLFPPLSASLASARPTHAALDTHQAYTFLRETAPVLEAAGFGVLVPPWWSKPGSRLGVRLRLRSDRRKDGTDASARGLLSLDNLVQFQWEVALGDTVLTREEFEALVALKTPLVQLRGQWVQLDPQQIEAAIRFWDKQHAQGTLSLHEAVRMGLDAEVEAGDLPITEVEAEGDIGEWLEHLKGRQVMEELPQPAGLNGRLRPYQRQGYSWLAFLQSLRLGACLADDMGLGKTIQTLALLLRNKETGDGTEGPVLLVCPTSVVTNWEREVRRFAPSLKTLVHQGGDRLTGPAFEAAASSADVVLTSYALLRRDVELIQSVTWSGVILDEAQNIKNPTARQSRAAYQLRAGFRVALTGTPVENRLSDLWSLFHFLNPGYLGSRDVFRKRFALPIERYADAEATQRLKRLVTPFILRRVKTDPRVIQDLPEKIETKVYCPLVEEQATLYEGVVRDVLERIASSEGMERRGLVLSMLMQLKQICNHPMQFLHQTDGASGQPGDIAGRSGKLARLTAMLEETVAVGDRVLIFTQFAEMGHLLRSYLPAALGCPTLFLHGGVPPARRDQMVARFQDDGTDPLIFILSLKAGGTGLNLTRASHVFHFDRWWNPAVEDQATDRAFRIGQVRNVQVHKFVTTGTLEERIDDLIESKKALAQTIVGAGETWLTDLSTDDLRELVTLRR
jgi:SNF2 family DNA or RNA helicase